MFATKKDTFNSKVTPPTLPSRTSSARSRKDSASPGSRVTEQGDSPEFTATSSQTTVKLRNSKDDVAKGKNGPEPFKRHRRGQKTPNVDDQDFNLKDLHEKTGTFVI